LEPAAFLPVAWAGPRHEKPAHALLIFPKASNQNFKIDTPQGEDYWAARLRRAFALERFSQLLEESQHL